MYHVSLNIMSHGGHVTSVVSTPKNASLGPSKENTLENVTLRGIYNMTDLHSSPKGSWRRKSR